MQIISGQYIAAIYNNFEYKCNDGKKCDSSKNLRDDFPTYFNTYDSGESSSTYDPGVGVGVDKALIGHSAEWTGSVSKPTYSLPLVLFFM